MKDNAGIFLNLNDSIIPVQEWKEISIKEDTSAYEVIRIINKVPLFFTDHYKRLQNSLHILGLKLIISEQILKQKVQKVIDANDQKNCNVKVITYNDHDEQNILLYISKSYYPNREEIENGIPVQLVQWERENPNAKIVNQKYKEIFNRKMKEGNVFEILLVNSAGQITEGSKSNIFFVKGTTVFTAPGEVVLKGITRKYVIEACRQVGVNVVEQLTTVGDLNDMEGGFISGTSIKVLPVAKIDNRRYSSSTHPTIVAVRDRYDQMIEEYIRQYRC